MQNFNWLDLTSIRTIFGTKCPICKNTLNHAPTSNYNYKFLLLDNENLKSYEIDCNKILHTHSINIDSGNILHTDQSSFDHSLTFNCDFCMKNNIRLYINFYPQQSNSQNLYFLFSKFFLFFTLDNKQYNIDANTREIFISLNNVKMKIEEMINLSSLKDIADHIESLMLFR